MSAELRFLTPCLTLVSLVIFMSCNHESHLLQDQASENQLSGQEESKRPTEDEFFVRARGEMVRRQLAGRDIEHPKVLEVMGKVRRHLFVPASKQKVAYQDSPQPIGKGQTISQPYIVALMTQLVDPQPTDKALDIGTGSGYQAAVLAQLVHSVHSIEIVQPLADSAAQRLAKFNYDNITVRHGDGYAGWESESPFDIIIVAAAPDHVPKALVEQLAEGGKMVIPVGDAYQELILIEKDSKGAVKQTRVAPVRFVPMTGKAQKRK